MNIQLQNLRGLDAVLQAEMAIQSILYHGLSRIS